MGANSLKVALVTVTLWQTASPFQRSEDTTTAVYVKKTAKHSVSRFGVRLLQIYNIMYMEIYLISHAYYVLHFYPVYQTYKKAFDIVVGPNCVAWELYIVKL